MNAGLVAAIMAAACLIEPVRGGTKIDDPVTFVRGVYSKLEATKHDGEYEPPQDIYTPRLAALFELDKREADEMGELVGNIWFEFWTNGNARQIRHVRVTGEFTDRGQKREIVTAQFHDSGEAKVVRFFFEKEESGWKLDDARAIKGGAFKSGWTLSLVLKYGDYLPN